MSDVGPMTGTTGLSQLGMSSERWIFLTIVHVNEGIDRIQTSPYP